MTTLTPVRSSRKEFGQGMVEFALVAPFFFALVFAIVEGALLMNGQAAIDNADREGARVAALCGSTQGQIIVAGIANTGLPCEAAIGAAVQSNLGFLPFTQQNPVVIVCTPAADQLLCPSQPDPAGGPCPVDGAGGWVGTGPGTEIEVDVKYAYNYYAGHLLGAALNTCITSSARAVSQQ